MPADHPPEKRIDPHLSRPPDRPLPGSSRPKETLQAVRRRRGSRPASRSSYAAASRAPTRDHKAGETDALRERFAAHHSHHLHSTVSSNPYAERFVRTIRTECLNHFVIFGERHLRVLLREFCAHYNEERFHQGLGGQLIRPAVSARNDSGPSGTVKRRSRLGAMLNFYHREAA